MRIFSSINSLIGNTPIVKLDRFKSAYDLSSNIFAKLEFFNPAGSVKDRVAAKMIEDAEKDGKISKGATIIEPTSGNTGIGIAAVAVSKGYRAIITMPDTMSEERIKIMEAYGAKVVLTEGSRGMTGAIEKAEELSCNIENSIILGQFTNPSNPMAHYETTGPEIWNDMDGEIDIFVSAVGTGGTISGIGKYLKERNPKIKIVAAEPLSSPVLSGGQAAPHKIQGIGAGFIPKTLDINVIDEIIAVSNEDAYRFGADITKTEGILVGISSGAALAAAAKIAKLEENKDKNIVVILPDTGMRYLSTPHYY